MKSKLIVANWKMHGDLAMAKSFFSEITLEKFSHQVEVAVLPPSLFIPLANDILSQSKISYGVQNISEHEQGAYTGEISVKMLPDFHCKYILIGHSERRQYYAETDELVARKIQLTQRYGFTPIVCVGETLEQYDKQQTHQVIATQLQAISSSIASKQNLVVAYEPVWAIGSGKTPTLHEIAKVHEFIRKSLLHEHPWLADHLQILYGGSVKPENAAEIFSIAAVDGALVGGASLKLDSFIKVIQSCNS